MQGRAQGPVIYWVVGDGTDIGKTTIAAALIRELNASGKRTIGFKPVAVSRLQDIVDLLLDDLPVTQSRVFGSDAWKLTSASPLTGPDMVDLVVPVQVFCYPNWGSVVLARTGSASLGNVEYFCSPFGAALKERADLQRIIRKSGLPLEAAQLREDITTRTLAQLSPEKPALAFERLLDLGVDAVVCEGAARFLPLWKGGPPANHLVYLGGGTVWLIPDLKLHLSDLDYEELPTVDALEEILNNSRIRRYSVPHYLAEAGRHENMAREVATALLQAAQPA